MVGEGAVSLVSSACPPFSLTQCRDCNTVSMSLLRDKCTGMEVRLIWPTVSYLLLNP